MQNSVLVPHCNYLEATIVSLAILFDKKFESLMGFIEIVVIVRAMVIRKIYFVCRLHICIVYKSSFLGRTETPLRLIISCNYILKFFAVILIETPHISMKNYS